MTFLHTSNFTSIIRIELGIRNKLYIGEIDHKHMDYLVKFDSGTF